MTEPSDSIQGLTLNRKPLNHISQRHLRNIAPTFYCLVFCEAVCGCYWLFGIRFIVQLFKNMNAFV